MSVRGDIWLGYVDEHSLGLSLAERNLVSAAIEVMLDPRAPVDMYSDDYETSCVGALVVLVEFIRSVSDNTQRQVLKA